MAAIVNARKRGAAATTTAPQEKPQLEYSKPSGKVNYLTEDSAREGRGSAWKTNFKKSY